MQEETHPAPSNISENYEPPRSGGEPMTSARHCPGAFKKAKHDLKKLKVSPMSAIGIGILRPARSSGPTRPIEYSGSNRKNAVWILKRLAGWSTPMTARHSTAQ